MIDTTRFLEKFLQKQRFKRIKPYLKGDVLDFGGNEGELRELVSGEYLAVNYDHSVLEDKKFDTLAALAVVEHIDYDEVFKIFEKLCREHLKTPGRVFITTPTPLSKPILEVLVLLRLLDKENIEEHKHYWTKKELFGLAKKIGLEVRKYKKFQFGVNQMILLEKIQETIPPQEE